MIEEDIRDLERKYDELSDKFDRLVEAVSEGKFKYAVGRSYSKMYFDTEEGAWEWIASQKSRDKKTFMKKSWLYPLSVSEVKPKRVIAGFEKE